MRRRRKYRRLIAAAAAAGLIAAPPASAREGARPTGPAPTTRPVPVGDGPQAWLALIGLTGIAVTACGFAGPHPQPIA